MASGAEGVSDASLFSGLFGHGDVGAAVSDRALVDAMVEFEVALLRALAVLELAPSGAAVELAAAVDHGALEIDVAELGRATGEQGTPVPGLLRVSAAATIGRGRREPAQGRDEPGRDRHRDDARRPGARWTC